jgi:ATP-binding cassette subfamily C protein LapB
MNAMNASKSEDLNFLPNNFLWLAIRLPQMERGMKALSPHEEAALRQQIQGSLGNELEAKISLDMMCQLADQLLDSLGAGDADWHALPSLSSLPMMACSLTTGCYLIHSRNPDGTWLMERADGLVLAEVIPVGSKFRSFFQRSPKNKTDTVRAKLIATLKDHSSHFLYAAMASVVLNFLGLFTSLYSMQVYDRVIPAQGVSTLLVLSVGVAISIFLELISRFARSSIVDQSVKGIDLQLAQHIFERLLRVRMDQFPASVGTLSAQVRSYEMIRSFASNATLYLLVDTPFALLFLFVIFLIGGPVVASVPLVFFAFSLLISLLGKWTIERHSRQSMAASNRKLGLLVEVVEGAETIKANGSYWQFLAKWNSLTRLNVDEDMRVRHDSEAMSYIAGAMQQLSYALLVAAGAYIAVTSNELTSGAIIACSILSGRVLGPVSAFPGLMVQWANAKMALANLEQIYILKQDNHDIEHPISIDGLRGDIVLTDVAFAYPSRAQVLDIKSLPISAGERVGILGLVGSGKSTLLKLLAGLYHPQKGRITVDGLELDHINRSHLSQRIGYLPQEARLFGGTLRDNLLNGLSGINDPQLIEACRRTGLTQLIALSPKGLDMVVSESGRGFSAGQRQLIVLTRMLLADPDIWLFDEPTASMDESTEAQVLHVLRQAVKPGQTLIMVTHKPALLDLVDRLIILTPQGVAMDGPKHSVIAQINALNSQKNDAIHAPVIIAGVNSL